jgi:copper resistance protein B
MKSKNLLITVGTLALLPGVLAAQQSQQAAATQTPETPLASCAQVQPAVENIIAGAMSRLESARQTNDPAQMRAAVDHLGSALRDIRIQLAPCAAPAAADPHAGHAMPKTPPPAATVPTTKPATAADPHAGHDMPATKPAPVKPSAKPPTTGMKPKAPAAADPHAGHNMPPAGKTQAAPKTSTPKPPAKAADPHAGHTETPQAKKEIDPVNGLTVDPATAPKTTYQGRTYYFSSELSLKQFVENPSKYAKPPKK